MRQRIVPICERGGRNRIRRDLESAKSPAQQVDSQGAKGQNQNRSRESKFLEPPHVGSKPILKILKTAVETRSRPPNARDSWISNCCADHPSGDNQRLSNLLQARELDIERVA